jgi:CubicO group peptidase (beta-lactamase class C family)
MGRCLLAYIVEKFSGESYATYLAHHIFEPLKMTHSGFATMAAVVPQMSEGYSREGSTLMRLTEANEVNPTTEVIPVNLRKPENQKLYAPG